ncbi:MAG: hypothetical protein EAZ39_03325, partial [Oscillatoriales cyanobacterium]
MGLDDRECRSYSILFAGIAVAVAIERSIAVSTGKLAANLAVRELICSANSENSYRQLTIS